MTQEQRELLVKDLCARLPYGIKAFDNSFDGVDIINLIGYDGEEFVDDDGYWHSVEDIKPYLFPLSSMTEEQDKEYALLQTSAGKEGFLYAWNCANMIEWLIENHFDYNGLIPKGLAIDATNKNIY